MSSTWPVTVAPNWSASFLFRITSQFHVSTKQGSSGLTKTGRRASPYKVTHCFCTLANQGRTDHTTLYYAGFTALTQTHILSIVFEPAIKCFILTYKLSNPFVYRSDLFLSSRNIILFVDRIKRHISIVTNFIQLCVSIESII